MCIMLKVAWLNKTLVAIIPPYLHKPPLLFLSSPCRIISYFDLPQTPILSLALLYYNLKLSKSKKKGNTETRPRWDFKEHPILIYTCFKLVNYATIW